MTTYLIMGLCKWEGMDVLEAIRNRIDIRDYADEPVADDIKRDILDAARLGSSGRNTQHWRFVLVQDDDELAELADRSPSGEWASKGDFAIAVLTKPEWDFHQIDAGKAITHMQLAAWDHGVGAGMYTTDAEAVDDFLEVPETHELTGVVVFGYPKQEIQGIKDRKPLSEIAFSGSFGSSLALDE